jgi:signal transduction histidine kinase
LSPEQPTKLPSGSRLAALLDSRRWLLVLLLSEAWLFAAIVGAAQWRRLPTGDRLALGLGLAVLIAGWILSRRTIGLWLVSAAPALLVLATLLNNGGSGVAAWIALSTSAAHVAYALVLLTPRWVGLASIPLLSAVLAVDWAHRPTDVFPGALAVAGGWIAVVSLALSALALWAAWHSLVRLDIAADESTARLASRMADEIAAQERSRMWREAAVAVHERLLSTIRYLLQSPEPDRQALRAFISSGDVLDAVVSQTDLTHSVRVSTAARIASGILTLDPTMIDLPLDNDTRAAGRAAVVECALNAVLHGGATEVIARASMDRDRVRVTVSDNGSGLPTDAAPGLGWRTVLDEGLAAVSGTWSISRVGDLTVVTIDVPAATETSTASLTDDGFRQGRTLLSAPLIAVGAVGVALDVAALHGTLLGWFAILVALAATAGGVALVMRRQAPATWESLLVIAGLASIPWVTALAP